jgi:flagellar assembly factor FliW
MNSLSSVRVIFILLRPFSLMCKYPFIVNEKMYHDFMNLLLLYV